MRPLYFRHESSTRHETGSHPENAARIAAIEAELERREWLGYERREAPAAELSALTAVHPRSHVDEIRELSERGGGEIDFDTVASAGSYEAALHAAGGACALVEALVRGEAPTGFAALRPPGHHAETALAMGFCLFNNVAVAAQYALDQLGLERVLVLDWDVHHGNGTNDIFHASRKVLYASIHQYPLYPGTGPASDSGSGDGEGYTVNLPVPAGSGEDTWAALVEHVVAPVGRAFRPQLVLVSAGYDAHAADPLGSCALEDVSFGQMARQMRALAGEVGAPIGGVLEGGYALDALARSVAVTLEAFAGDAEPSSFEPDAATEAARAVVGRHWPL